MLLELPPGSWWDWEIHRYDGWNLRLIADFDLTYHWNLEVVLAGVTYLSCPTSFQDPVFREPTVRERALVRRYDEDESLVLVAFDVDSLPCLIAAESVEVRHGLVRRELPS